MKKNNAPLNELDYSEFYWQTKPEPLLKNMPEWWKTSNIRACPATNDMIKNTFVLRFFHDYEVTFDNENVSSPHGTQHMFDNYIDVSSVPVIQIFNGYTFFSDKPLIAEVKHPYWHTNDFTKKANVVSGEFDIGQWFRTFYTAAVLQDKKCNIRFHRDDISSYIKFKTNEKINLIEFKMIPQLEEFRLMSSVTHASKIFGGPTQLKELYKKFAYRNSRKHILKLIKENIV